jgi:hypothetical protein
MINQTDRVLNLDEARDLLHAYRLKQEIPEVPFVCTESVLDGKICILLEIPLNSPERYSSITVSPEDAFKRWKQTQS